MAANQLADGFVRICIDPSANVFGDPCRVVYEGQYIACEPDGAIVDPACQAVVPDVLRKITSARDVDAMYGAGSVLAESLKLALRCCGNAGVQVYALPRMDAEGSTKAEYTLTVIGDATSDGRVDIYWGDAIYNISVRVYEGDSAEAIATVIAAAVPEGFPYTATAAAGVITLTAKNGGTVGNFLNPEINWHKRNDYLPAGVGFEWKQTVVGAGDPAPLDYKSVLGSCCVCCYGLLSGNQAWQDGVIAYFEDAWDCSKPQCFGHAYTYNAGSLGQILADDTNSATISRMAHCVDDPMFPWLKVANYTIKSCCLTVTNPETSIQGDQFGVLDCVKQPESCSSCWTFEEQEQLRDSGFVVTVPLSGGEGGLTSPKVTNDITNNRFDAEGRENATFRDVSSRRLAAETARQFATELQKFNGLGLYTKRTNIPEGIRGTNIRLMLGAIRAWVKSKVGALFSEPEDLDSELTIKSDFEVQPPCLGQPGKVHVSFQYRPPVRISQIVTNFVPKMLDNCDR